MVAPLFQRSYVWTEEVNWMPLWSSLIECFERRLNSGASRPYFLGAIVLDKVSGATGSVTSREIIDGQQRMTTLQIMMQAAVNIFYELGLEFQAGQFRKLTRNDLEIVSDEIFKIWPTNIDRAQFRSVMTGEPADGKMADALRFFDAQIREWLQPNIEGLKERASAMVDAVKQDLTFVAIDLNDDDDGQLIFETLNSLGTPLLASDLMKNLLFRAAAANKLDTNTLYSQYWEAFEREGEYWKAIIPVGRRDRTRLDVFLQFYLTYKLKREPIVSHQFREYRDAFRDGAFGSVEEALRDFAKFSKLYQSFDQSKEGAAGSIRYVLEILDTGVPNSLILGFYDRAESEVERDALFGILESYLMRRFLCGLNTKQYNRMIADLIVKLNASDWTAVNLRNCLLELEGVSTTWPDDNWLIWRQKEREAYGGIKRTGVAFALSKVEESLRGDKSESRWNTRTPLTIEHLMPQKWEEHWPLEEDTPESRNVRYELLDKMGNLTVLTKKLNSSISNGPWVNKRKHLNEHTVLLMNSALAAHEDWSEERIELRSKELGEKFCTIWPR